MKIPFQLRTKNKLVAVVASVGWPKKYALDAFRREVATVSERLVFKQTPLLFIIFVTVCLLRFVWPTAEIYFLCAL